jgi:FMN reductase
MRPLFGFFQALTLPLGIYGTQDDFVDYRIEAPELRERIATTVERIVPLIALRRRPPADRELARPAVF